MPARKISNSLRRFGGVGANTSSHHEKWISGLGGLCGILGVLLVSQNWLGLEGSVSLVASMGASAVLLFAVPHGPLSQPWSVFGGHMVSAIIGISCIRLGLQPLVTAALAVALAISAMYYLRCIHPPGGATALTAAVGGPAVEAMGYQYVLTPVLLNVLVILSVAIVFNLAFPWRRYPAAWARKPAPATAPDKQQATQNFTRDALTSAAGAIGPASGQHGEHLATLCTLAECIHSDASAMLDTDIRVGAYYCNGKFGSDWQVRQVNAFKDPETDSSDEGRLFYRVVAGNKRGQANSISRKEFANWARYEVMQNESSWQRIDTTAGPLAVENAA